MPDALAFDYAAATQRAVEMFGLTNWTVTVLIDKKLQGNGRTGVNHEYLEATIKFNPKRVANEGRDPQSIVEHEVMHIILEPLTEFVRKILKAYVLDEKVREQFDNDLDIVEHHALETIHRGFRPAAHQWSGRGGTW